MSVTVTKTARSAVCSERWNAFTPLNLQNVDSFLSVCRLGASDSSKWGSTSNYGFEIPADATITDVAARAYWWGSNTGGYIQLVKSYGGGYGVDRGAVSGRWVEFSSSDKPTPSQVNGLTFGVDVTVGRTTGEAVNVFIDQITVSVTYEPYVAPPTPPTGVPTVITQPIGGVHSNYATGSGTVTSDGGSAIVNFGFCTPVPWSSGSLEKTIPGVGDAEAFTATLPGLAPSTFYYYRTYAGNENGYAYGNVATFLTSPQKAGDGGIGLISSLSGQSTGYAGGGGGGMFLVGTAGFATQGGAPGRCFAQGNGYSGEVNTGGGGGGAGQLAVGGSGGKGVVVIRYKTADAIATSPSLSTNIFRPSLAYRAGRLFAPYSVGENAKILTITGNTLANPTVVTTSVAHGIPAATAQVVVIAGSVTSVPIINGSYVATRVSDTTFSIPVNVTTAGTAGRVLYNRSVGWALTAGGYNDVGWLTQSPTTFHTGSMKKDFRYVSVSHDVLPDGATIRPVSWLIDGVYGTSDGVAYSLQETRFPIDLQGYSIETTQGMTPDYTKAISPVIRGVNVIWNFVKNRKHTYSLDCRSGANAGRWGENPDTALKFLYSTANERATFEDRFAGVYRGAIESVEFTPAPISLSEGPSGIAKVVIREEA